MGVRRALPSGSTRAGGSTDESLGASVGRLESPEPNHRLGASARAFFRVQVMALAGGSELGQEFLDPREAAVTAPAVGHPG